MAKNEISQPDKYDNWAVESAADTLIRAEEIKADAKMMKFVAKKIEERKAALEKVSKREELLYGKDKK